MISLNLQRKCVTDKCGNNYVSGALKMLKNIPNLIKRGFKIILGCHLILSASTVDV